MTSYQVCAEIAWLFMDHFTSVFKSYDSYEHLPYPGHGVKECSVWLNISNSVVWLGNNTFGHLQLTSELMVQPDTVVFLIVSILAVEASHVWVQFELDYQPLKIAGMALAWHYMVSLCKIDVLLHYCCTYWVWSASWSQPCWWLGQYYMDNMPTQAFHFPLGPF